MRRISPLIITLGLLLLGTHVAAQSSSSNSSSTSSVTESTGALVKDQMTALQKKLLLYSFTDRSALVSSTKKEASFAKLTALWRSRKIANRKDCVQGILRSSKGTRFDVVTRCFKAELTLDMNYYAKLKDAIDALPSISDHAKAQSEARLVKLTDALSAVIDGVDGKVYASEEALHQAKQKLLDLYVTPYWIAQVHLHADRALGWTALFLKEFGVLTDVLPASNAAESSFLNAATCLNGTTDTLLASTQSEDYKETKKLYSQALSALSGCKTAMGNAVQTYRQSGLPASTSSGSSAASSIQQ